MADYVRQSNKLLLRGMNITLPANRLGMEWAELLKNVRCYRVGEWRQRPGLTDPIDVDAGSTASVLWISRINDILAGTFRRMVATADGEAFVDNAGHTAYTLADSGYSANPYTSVVARPDRSPLPYLFLANDARQSKFSTTGARTEWGLAAPTAPPTTALSQIAYRVINECESSAGFFVTNGASSTQTRVGAVAITYLIFDTGTTGWVSVVPATLNDNIQPGMFLTIGGTETFIVESVYQPITSTTIESILYDSGSTGLCSIQLATPTQGLQRNSVIRLNGSENVRVLSVTTGPDGVPSLRCSTSATMSAGQTVDGLRSFRAYFTAIHTTAETLSADYVQIAVAGAGLATLGVTGAIDLSSTDAVADRPIQEDDYIHVSLRVADWTLLTEIQLQFDVDSATNDFTKNYFFKSIRPPDLLAAYEQTASSLTAQQQEIQRQQIDDYRRQELMSEQSRLQQQLDSGTLEIFPEEVVRQRLAVIQRELGGGIIVASGQGALSDPGVGGANQWTELRIPIREFQRVGSDTSRGWANVAAFQISINATAALNVGLNALWIGGTYGPTVEQALSGYTYMYRARNSSTGTKSNPSPPTRSPELPFRGAVTITIPSGYPDAQADVFDIFRAGGSVPDYHYIGTVDASASLTFVDEQADDWVLRQDPAEFDLFKPWPRSDRPKAGVVTVAGTSVIRVSGDTFDTEWVRNSQVIIGDQAFSLYSNPSSTGRFELNESAGSLIGATLEIPEATLDGQPMPIVFGPYGASAGDFYFGLGDPLNPGFLYFTNGNDPESASDSNYLELCGPSETLMAGGILDGIAYVFSDLRSWRILPAFAGGQSGGASLFYAQPTAMGRGVATRWALAFGDRIYFVSFDGVYASRGDAIESLTDESIAPLFRRDGSGIDETFASGSLVPISFASADQQYLSLTYSIDGLYLTYRGVDSAFYSLYYSFLTRGWMLDTFSNTAASRFYREEQSPGTDNILIGSTGGAMYRLAATVFADDGFPINCQVNTREEDWGDTRAQKQIGDCAIDCDPDGQTVSVTLIYDQGDSFYNMADLTGAGREMFTRDIQGGLGDLKRSCQLQATWLGSTGITKLYEWQPAALVKPALTVLRATDWTVDGYPGAKWLQGCRITGDSYNENKALTILGDDGATVASIIFNSDGEQTRAFSWPPVVTHQMRILGADADDWRLMNVEWIWEPEPEITTWWETQFTTMDLPGYFHIREMLVAHRSTTDIDLTIIIDGVSYSYTIANSGGARARTYFPVQAIKGKYFTFRLESAAGFSLYAADLEVRAGSWGRNDFYNIIRPFGDLTRTKGGARI